MSLTRNTCICHLFPGLYQAQLPSLWTHHPVPREGRCSTKLFNEFLYCFFICSHKVVHQNGHWNLFRNRSTLYVTSFECSSFLHFFFVIKHVPGDALPFQPSFPYAVRNFYFLRKVVMVCFCCIYMCSYMSESPFILMIDILLHRRAELLSYWTV